MGYSSAQVKSFINMIAPIIVTRGKARGYKVFSTTIAQAIIEGAAGTSVLAKTYHNHFGLKCGSAWMKAGKPSVNMKTKEEYKVGNLVTINDYFRVYANDIEGVKGYYDFISTKRYANLKTANNYTEFANMLKSDGYATSSTYVNTLCATVKKYELEKYDTGNPVVQAQEPYVVGKTYTTTSDLNIREQPFGTKMKFECITQNAKEHAFFDDYGNAILKKGTRVTCKAISKQTNSIWILIPSGWICARNSKNIYIV